MSTKSELTSIFFEQLRGITSGSESPEQLNSALRLLAKWRSVLIRNTVLHHIGTKVASGVFAGMNFLPKSAEGCHVAKLLGCYEQPLQPVIEEAIRANYPLVINIGCAEGYYAVGLACRMPNTKVMAFDVNENARMACGHLAEKNGVRSRVEIGGLFRPESFGHYADRNALVICDIEGAEKELLDPDVSPALRSMDLIVEAHDILIPGISKMLRGRFEASHVVTQIDDNGHRRIDGLAWFQQWNHLDQLLAAWEWRSGPTPWLVMKRR